MDIFNTQLSEDTLRVLEFKRITDKRKSAIDQFTKNYVESFDEFWNNPILSPQQQCDMLNTHASDLIVANEAIVSLLMDLNPQWIPPEMPRAYTKNEDGTVTIHD